MSSSSFTFSFHTKHTDNTFFCVSIACCCCSDVSKSINHFNIKCSSFLIWVCTLITLFNVESSLLLLLYFRYDRLWRWFVVALDVSLSLWLVGLWPDCKLKFQYLNSIFWRINFGVSSKMRNLATFPKLFPIPFHNFPSICYPSNKKYSQLSHATHSNYLKKGLLMIIFMRI